MIKKWSIITSITVLIPSLAIVTFLADTPVRQTHKSRFINWYYNNARQKNIRQYYTWDGKQFVIKPVGEEDIITMYENGKTTKDDQCDMQYIKNLNAQTQFFNRNPDIPSNSVISQSPD